MQHETPQVCVVSTVGSLVNWLALAIAFYVTQPVSVYIKNRIIFNNVPKIFTIQTYICKKSFEEMQNKFRVEKFS